MTIKSRYDTEQDAIDDLVVHGFKPGNMFWSKPSTDGFGFPMTALAAPKLNWVDPKYNQPDYWTIEFHNH